LADGTLETLWSWDEPLWLRRMEGSAIRRIGWARWRRNLAVALGNALAQLPPGPEAQALKRALLAARDEEAPLVREHIDWALAQEPQPARPTPLSV
jgi:epoxyqueuosine reductase